MIQKIARNGFGLLEILLYISCSSMLFFFFCSYMWNLHKAVCNNFSISHHYLNLFRAHDLLIESIQTMAREGATLSALTSSSLTLSHKTATKTWFLEDKKLILYTQDIPKKRSWKTVVAEGIDSISFVPDSLLDGTVRALECCFVSGKKTVRRYGIL